MRIAASTSVGRIRANTKRPPDRRWSAAEGLTTRRRNLLMAGTQTMYPCPRTGANLSNGRGRTDG
jgi:hypothetical protein